MDSTFSLREFIDINKDVLPERVKVTGGVQCGEDEDLPTGTVLDLHSVHVKQINLVYKEKGRKIENRIAIHESNPTKFQILDYHPVGHVYTTVKDLIEVCPFVVKCNKTWRSDDGAFLLEKDEILKLIRLVVGKNWQRLLECKLVRQMKLVQLPMDCEGHFTAKKLNNFYTVSDLVHQFPKERKLKLVKGDVIDERNQIQGLPLDGLVTMLTPDLEVEYSMKEYPGDRHRLDVN
ncbi:unnamed protein product, partial [Owenia fusiformis]